MDQRTLLEEIIKQTPGYKGNEDLLDEIIEESVSRASGFLDTMEEDPNAEAYIKKIVSSVLVYTAKNADKIRKDKAKKEEEQNNFVEERIAYDTDKDGRIIYNIELGQPKKSKEQVYSDEEINTLKEKILTLEKNNPSKKYKDIFEHRFVKGWDNKQIAAEMNITEEETIETLTEIYKEAQSILIS